MVPEIKDFEQRKEALIKKGKELSDKEINYIVNVLMIWIVREVRKEGQKMYTGNTKTWKN